MKLDQFYRLETDDNNWILIYEREGEINEKTQKPKLTTKRSYHGNLPQALMKYVDQSLKTNETVEEILSMLEDLHKKIESLKR